MLKYNIFAIKLGK